MNLLFINTSKIWGGNEKWTYMAAHVLSDKHNVFLAYRSKSLGRYFSLSKKRCMFLNRFDAATLYQLVRYLRKKSIDVVVSTNRKYYLLGGLAARWAGCKHFVRCGIVWKVPGNMYYRFLFSRLIDGIIVNASPIREELLKSGFIPREKIHLIYNGLDLDKLEQGQKADIEKPFSFTIVSSGELVPRKGHSLLLESFARFLGETGIKDAGLVIMGKGRQEGELKTLASRLGIKDRTVFTGWLENPYPLMNRGDLFVSLSRNEGISNALLEAMYLKVPVISTVAGGTGDVLKNGYNGILVEHLDEKKLADFFRQVYEADQSKLDEMTRAARETVLEKFSVQEMASALEETFSQAIKA